MRYQFLRFPEGKVKALTFSYDDGMKQDVRLADMLTRYGLKGTFNLNSELFRQGSGMSQTDIEEHILRHGHEVAIHGSFHRAEGALRPIEGIREVLECRMELEQRYGRIIRGMAYPDSGIRMLHNGADYDKIKTYLQELDVAYARTLGGDNDAFMLPTDWHQWMPTARHDNPNIMTYIQEFLNLKIEPGSYGSRRYPRLFYIWGHSFEFDRNDNWEHMEQICQKFAQAEDIWFATNMEIYDYVQAYQSLVYSADGKQVYNPTLFAVWFEIDGRLYTIRSGETLRIS